MLAWKKVQWRKVENIELPGQRNLEKIGQKTGNELVFNNWLSVYHSLSSTQWLNTRLFCWNSKTTGNQ